VAWTALLSARGAVDFILRKRRIFAAAPAPQKKYLLALFLLLFIHLSSQFFLWRFWAFLNKESKKTRGGKKSGSELQTPKKSSSKHKTEHQDIKKTKTKRQCCGTGPPPPQLATPHSPRPALALVFFIANCLCIAFLGVS
jgi:hypothetical protein